MSPSQQITLASVIAAVEGPLQLALCCGDQEDTGAVSRQSKCDIEDRCRIKAPLRRVHERFHKLLNKVDLAYIAYDQVPVTLGVPYGVEAAEKALDQSCETGCSVPPGS